MEEATVLVRSHPRCLGHDPGLGHPESRRRLEVILDALTSNAAGWQVDRESPLPPDGDTIGMLQWVHDRDYIERVRAASERGHGILDSEDCRVSSATFDAAVAAAGLALQGALDLVNQRLRRAFLVLRPPSHHAERSRARGYCFFNSVALAAEVVASAWGEPVLIADFDAHHGNGTQQIFIARPDVGYVSVHAFPAFPGTGAADEVGEGQAAGTIRNIPLAPGADDTTFCSAFETALDEVASRLRPAAVIVSSGFNGHVADPVGGMRLTEHGYRRLTAAVVAVAERWARGRVLSILEGGFNLQALANCARIHVGELAAVEPAKADA